MRISRETVLHPSESLRCLTLQQAAFRGGLHRHAHAELTWIERGQGLRWVGDSVEPFFDGDLVLLGGELVHGWASQGEPREGGCQATVLQFPCDWAARTGLPELAGVAPLLLQARRGLQVQGSARDRVQQCLVRARSSPGVQRLAAFIEALGVLMDGAADLRVLAAEPGPAADAVGQGARRIDRVLSWIEDHLSEVLTVHEAASLAHVTPAAFARFFRREMGRSFIEYVNDARCSWAALRLLESQEPVAQIAHGCGFLTLSNFGEQFRRRHGLSPRAFRQLRGQARLVHPGGQQRQRGFQVNHPIEPGAKDVVGGHQRNSSISQELG
ncbi:MAG: helix-turn-helix domain-containing protein [Rubrivivax sp.]|nr:helix-turn-helix domain-containing protein [Rubrivivax sp.]